MTEILDPTSEPIYVQVDAPSLKRVDVASLANAFGRTVIRKKGAQVVRSMRGRVVLTYDIYNDSRPIWLIASVRRFARRLLEAVPHLPYFLTTDPEHGQALVMFAPLADPSALTDTGADFRDPTMNKAFSKAILAAADFATEVDDDSDAVVHGWMSVLPREITDGIGLEALKPN